MLPSPEMRMLGWMQRSSSRQTIRRPSSCILPSLPGLRGRLPRAGRERKSASRAACLLSVMLGPESLRRVCGKLASEAQRATQIHSQVAASSLASEACASRRGTGSRARDLTRCFGSVLSVKPHVQNLRSEPASVFSGFKPS